MSIARKYFVIIPLLASISSKTVSQTLKPPVAKFSFNEKKDYDEINNKKVKLEGTSFTTDRFGNENNAVFVSGNEFSYINLGTYKALKPKCGSISMWVKLEHPVWSGKGMRCNPLIITKQTREDDFYESYAIYYMLDTKRVVAVCGKDSTKELGVFTEKFERNKWEHLVICYDNKNFQFYLNGNLEGKFSKKFETEFLESDSVVIGVTANKKNNRWLNGCVDDIEFYEGILTQNQVNELYRAPNPNRLKIILNWIAVFFIPLLFFIGLYFFVKYRIRTAVKKEKARLELENKLLETELRVNRALMNPHFIFNSLNTLHNFVLNSETENASNYLVKFSKLIRKILESNLSDSINLELELEILNKYLEIEALRFEKKIDYTINVDPNIIPSTIQIPIMMLQPFIENAIWHGLLKKRDEKQLTISFILLNKFMLQCTIEDNGIGRQVRETYSPDKKSLAISFIQQRLELLNKMYHLRCSMIIKDKPNNTGTIVVIDLPILNSKSKNVGLQE